MQKRGIRIAAFEDGPFARTSKSAIVVGVVGREKLVEGILSFKVRVDGNDATEKLLGSLRGSRFMEQIRLIAINGITFAGLNLVNTKEVYGRLRIPIVAITRKRPHSSLLKDVIAKSSRKDAKKKIRALDEITKSSSLSRTSGFYVQRMGIKEGIGESTLNNALELLRLAHLIASGIVRGESKGRM